MDGAVRICSRGSGKHFRLIQTLPSLHTCLTCPSKCAVHLQIWATPADPRHQAKNSHLDLIWLGHLGSLLAAFWPRTMSRRLPPLTHLPQ